jgi:prepilin-type N-terminal cleavage/methylation domain-containing protein
MIKTDQSRKRTSWASRKRQRPEGRPAFTLVELLVSLALILFIMAILSQAFVTGMETFREMKGIGDMEERLRSAVQILRRDLAADHFEGRRHLSDPDFWNTPVREGFFRITQNSPRHPMGPAYFEEGLDLDQIASFRADDHALHFSVKLRGNAKDRVFSANAPLNFELPPGSGNFYFSPLLWKPPIVDPSGPAVKPTLGGAPIFQEWLAAPGPNTFWPYHSPWAEIMYALLPTGEFAGSTPIFSLRRAQRVVVPDNRQLNWPAVYPPQQPFPPECGKLPVPAIYQKVYQEFAFRINEPGVDGLYFLNPSDLAGTSAGPPKRSVIAVGAETPVLLHDVISFHVQVLRPGTSADFDDVYRSIQKPWPGAVALDTYAPWNLPAFSAGLPPNVPTSIKAIQISIRVWDRKTEQTRQVTFVQVL